MRLYDIINGKVEMNPSALSMPEFRALWSRDDSEEHEKAVAEISYVVYLMDESINNPYRAYRSQVREQTLLKDYIYPRLGKKWKPDKLVKNALNKYEEATKTTNSRLLEKAKGGAEKLADYFESIDFSEIGEDGKSKYSASELARNLSAVGNIVKSLNQLEEMVKKEQMESSTVRGGGEIGYYEMPREDFDYGD